MKLLNVILTKDWTIWAIKEMDAAMKLLNVKLTKDWTIWAIKEMRPLNY